jgi:small GTP-binding protein
MLTNNDIKRPTFLQPSISFSTTTASDHAQESHLDGLYRLLSPEERSLLQEQRQLTEASRQLAAQIGGASMDHFLKSSSFLEELQLDSTFLVVIAGEFNAGKSTLINALLGTKLLETGALPTTDSITIVAAEHDSQQETDSNATTTPLGLVVHSVKDMPLLEDLTLVDSPGTNSTWIDHTERTLKLLPSADLILFVTSAERPFSESERVLLQNIQAYRKSIVVVINKMDVLDTSGGDHGKEQKQAVVDFVTDKASELLGARPVVIPVSSRNALSAKLMEKQTKTTIDNNNAAATSPLPSERSTVYQRSNFATLESFLKESLTTQAKLKSKLSSPIGVVEGIMTECLQQLKEERDALHEDVATLNIFQSQFEGWKKELTADLLMSRKTMVEMVQQEGQRCDVLLNRIQGNPLNFVNLTVFDTAHLQEEWEHTQHEASTYRHNQSLKADLMELVHETA